jgi:broad specificity phosphatase PhoE
MAWLQAKPSTRAWVRRVLTVNVLWARHGQNVANLTGTFSHRIFDGDLTGPGCRQARELGDRLAAYPHNPVGQLVCSPLRRARQTAEIVGLRLGLSVAMELDDLRELDVGALDGRNDDQAWAIYARVLAAWKAGDAGARFPDGEDCQELCARLRRALAAVSHNAGGVTSLVVAHGANLRAALPGLTGDLDPGVDLPTGGVAVMRVDSGDLLDASVQLLSWPGTAYSDRRRGQDRGSA